MQRTEPRSVTLAELPAHLWAKPAYGPGPFSLTFSYLTTRGAAYSVQSVQGSSNNVTALNNNKLKRNEMVLDIRSWDQSEALMICAHGVSFLTWWQCGTPTGDRTQGHAPGHGPSANLGWRGRWP